MRLRPIFYSLSICALAGAFWHNPAALAQGSPPPFVQRGLPGAGQKALEPLQGEWDVTMTLFIASGSPQKPDTTKLIAIREWIAGGRFLRDVTRGKDYYRQGTFGYSNMDRRFEWVTQDALNAGMMIYQAAPGSGPRVPANLTGAFTDQGLLGEQSRGKRVQQRIHLSVQDRDHHRIDLYFKPVGGKERLVSRQSYVRRR